MKIFMLLIILLPLFTSGEQPTTIEKLNSENSYITNSKQLTFEGARSGEGYFSQNGEELIFQSERMEGNPFYQIYKMNLKSGNTEMISTGKGQTTCAWFHPKEPKVLFSSTHLDSQNENKVRAELALRKQPTQKYSWSFDENYDIFEKNLKTGKLKNLTSVKGYDAEGSYSPDGKWIAFASNRFAYSNPMSETDRKIFESDSSYMMDIYIMKADGSQVKQLTNHLGYDGGPFFSQDGKKITWRRFSANGQTAEIYTMNLDGSEQKQLTHLNVMSWAPFFHPSGKYIIFTTNIHGFQNFELYIVDSEGLKAPARVTNEEGFDGLPVFSPDGNSIAWTKRNNKGESQIHLGKWNHEAALKSLGLEGDPLSTLTFSSEISKKDLKFTIDYLASAPMQGRLTGSPQEKIYSSEIAKIFKKWGLSQAPNTKDYINEFEFLSNVELGEKNELNLNGKKLILGKDWNPVSFSLSGEIKESSIVFAGYGIKAPATEKFQEYDSYRGLEVKNKWVLIFRDIPNDTSGEYRYHLNFYSRIQHKITVAKNAGAKGVLFVSGPLVSYKQKLPKFEFEGSLSDSSLAVVNIDDGIATDIFSSAGKNIEKIQKSLDDGTNQEGFALDKTMVSAIVDIHPVRSFGHSALASINIPGAKETIFIGAHGDHLGLGIRGVSLATSEMNDRIHYGADDNASGVASVLELAHFFSKNKSKLKTNIIFSIWSGEELGNLGSKHYLEGLAKLQPSLKIKSYINLDMVGRLKQNLYIQGTGSSKEWKSVIEKLGSENGVSLVTQDDPYLPTDAMSFYVEAKVPVVSFFTGSHMEYHTPLDTADKINFDGLYAITNLVKDFTLITSSQKLNYQTVASSHTMLAGRKFRVYLGTIPDYSQEGIKGVKISGTTEKSPAEKAGLKAQDIIIQLADQKIENLYDFTYALQIVKPGTETKIKVLRGQNTLDLTITPGIKE